MIINSISFVDNNKKYSVNTINKPSFKKLPTNTASFSIAAASAISALILGLIQVNDAIKNAELVKNTDTKYLFTSVDDIKKDLIAQINGIESKNGDFPDVLRQKLINAIENNNFDLRSVYDEYYSTLSLCETLEEVSELYPHIIYPKTPETDLQSNFVPTRPTEAQCKKEKSIKDLIIGKTELSPRRKHDKGDIEKAIVYMLENSRFKDTETVTNIVQTASHANTKDPIHRFMKSFNTMINEYPPEYSTEEQLISLFTIMSQCSPKTNSNIVKFYEKLISKPENEVNKILLNAMKIGWSKDFVKMIGSVNHEEDLDKIFEIINKHGISSFILKNTKEYLDLYSISDNKDVTDDLYKILDDKKIKVVTELIKQKPDAKEILENYKKQLSDGQQTITINEVINILNYLKIDKETINQFIDDIFPWSNNYKSLASNKNFFKRFDGKNFDKGIISAIKQIYLENKVLTDVIVPIDEDDFGRATSFGRYRWSTPNKEVLNILKTSDNVHSRLYSLKEHLSEMDDTGLKTLARKGATANYWHDFHDYTRNNWMPIRLIKDKQYNENTIYTLDNLVTSYLYDLYQESLKHPDEKIEYPSNPLEKVGQNKHLNKYMRNIIHSAYMNIYTSKHADNSYIYFKSNEYFPAPFGNDFAEFLKFCKKDNHFDFIAIKKSFQNMENIYKKRFYRMYHFDKDRFRVLKEDMEKALALVDEKANFEIAEKKAKQTITSQDVQGAISGIKEEEGVDDTSKIAPDELSRLTFFVQNMKNNILKLRCLPCLNVEYIDADYFKYVYNIIQKSIEKDKDGNEILNETKALILFQLGDKYLETCNNDLTLEEFIEQELQEYKIPDGEYDYEKYYNDLSAELNFYSNIALVGSMYQEEFVNFVSDLVMLGSLTYERANNLLQNFISIPESMRSIVKNEIVKIEEAPTNKDLGNIQKIIDIIKSWHADKPEIIILNEAGIDKKVIITANAKMQMWEKYNGNYILYDQQLKKFFNSAKKYAASEKDNGIKTLRTGGVELKVMGEGGGMRMYSRPILPEDSELFKTSENDTMPIKYIFDSYDKHK